MENKINVAELLRNCPKGMEFDCLLCDSPIALECVKDKRYDYPIKAVGKDGFHHVFTKYGTSYNHDDAKCVIFPKGKTTWEGFVPPCKFKDGDIIFIRTSNYTWVSIFKQFSGSSCCTYVDLCMTDNDLLTNTRDLCNIEDIITQRLATEEEKQKLFDTIKKNGYKWNPETKTLEKIKPEFKVGDTITNGKTSITIGYIDNEYYYGISRNIANRLSIKNQDEWDLISEKFPNRFNINTLVPFESRVLVRDNKLQKWSPAIWGFYDSDSKDYQYKLVGIIARYCIPYEGNEHLLGTTDDCDKFYETWE